MVEQMTFCKHRRRKPVSSPREHPYEHVYEMPTPACIAELAHTQAAPGIARIRVRKRAIGNMLVEVPMAEQSQDLNYCTDDMCIVNSMSSPSSCS